MVMGQLQMINPYAQGDPLLALATRESSYVTSLTTLRNVFGF
jgi:hypothetical protein